ncbi:MAG TPA: glycosyltransferase family 2 protein [Mariprofundaceae bacterium]|nr:glycosyltransferase family 2 protein [Mariprofundaceae bacterium]
MKQATETQAGKLTVIILTLNEERHIRRCIESVRQCAARVVVVDSGSTDATCDIARSLGADILNHPFKNYAQQFNWALDHAAVTTEWIMRLDADEYITPELADRLIRLLPSTAADVDGYTIRLRRYFQGRWLRHGSLYPIHLLRIWRCGRGRLEERWMDEHVVLEGRIADMQADFIDDNLKPLTWWIEKHNAYASREAVDLLNLEYRFLPYDSVAKISSDQAGMKRWIKEKVYFRLPGGMRAFAYFLYRYVIRLGFLDGRAGTAFHFLQGFWYRYLVDAKVAEVKRYMYRQHCDVLEAIEQVLGIRI